MGYKTLYSCSSRKPSDSEGETPSERPTEKPDEKPDDSAKPEEPKGSSWSPWSLVLPAVLVVVFKAFYNFFRDNEDLIRRRFGLNF